MEICAYSNDNGHRFSLVRVLPTAKLADFAHVSNNRILCSPLSQADLPLASRSGDSRSEDFTESRNQPPQPSATNRQANETQGRICSQTQSTNHPRQTGFLRPNTD